MTTWRKLIEEEMGRYGETLEDAIACTLSSHDINVRFDSGFGSSEGNPFTLWTTNRVYFPVVYDGSEWVASVARNPDGNPTPHIGGE